MVDERAIAERYRLLSAQGVLDERTRRLWALLSKGMVDDPQKMLSELARLGARLIIQRAVEDEFDEWLERLAQSRQAVSQWRKRFCEEGLQGLEERPRPGRPRRFSPGAGDRGQGAGVRAAGRAGRPAVALVGR